MPPAADPAHRCSVLVVDDDSEIQELLRIALSGDGYDVATADNGRDALSHLRSTAETCLIVLDLGLPRMDGARFRAAQLRDRSLAWIPVIVTTGEIDGARIARDMGARAFVTKPIDVDKLRALVREIGCCHVRPRTDHRGVAI